MSENHQDSPAPQITTSQAFFAFFQREESNLRTLIDSLESTTLTPGARASLIEQCLTGITKLSNAIKDAAVYLPAYDQRTYAQGIKSLQERLQNARATFAPKQKFAFKNARKTVPAAPAASTSPSTSSSISAVTEPTTTTTATTSSVNRPALAESTPPPWKDRQIVYIPSPIPSPSNTSSHANTSTGTAVRNCTNCLITSPATRSTDAKLLPPPLASLTLRNLTSCVVFFPQAIEGPVHMTNLHNCVLLLVCRQFRMHESTGCDVYMRVGSRPIVEGCSGIRVAPAEERALRVDAGGFTSDGGSAGDVDVAGVSAGNVATAAKQVANCWDQVDDFGWLVYGRPSPNWRVLMPEERLKDDVWTGVAANRYTDDDSKRLEERLTGSLKLAGVCSSDDS